MRVAAAADLQFAMGDLAGRFEKQTGTKVAVSYGSSGNFRTQIQNGAPFDLFFSADTLYPQQLISAGFAEAQSLTIYAHGHLVLWAPAGMKLNLAERGFAALKDASVERIAVANPELAPYGRAAIAALNKAGIYEEVKTKLVFGESISQAAQFVESGSAQVGIIALSFAFAESMRSGEQWEIPEGFYPVMEQAAVVIGTSKNKTAARAFLEYVKSEEGRGVLSKYGLTLSARAEKP
ncbi:MAG TPA: molybdate ABC transporter substrate-binding protein [Candidatus Limnocylindrales bacterium]|nr:molybdate ABC transporter substrate-binding protein [Candidatus Limnocylindrales bacterium]